MKETRDAFTAYHPIINFTFFIGAFLFGMLLMHPAYLACSMVLSGAYYITIKKSAGIKYLFGMIPLFVLFSALNPVFNSLGNTVLFTYWKERNFTLEALIYGMILAMLFIAVLGWFASYNAVMTSDKFLYLFGKCIPSISMILTMVLRLVPTYQKKINQISSARKCIGKSSVDGNSREKIENGMIIVSALTSWALEGGIVTADSMRSRGFGDGKRTSFSLYKWEQRDWILLIFQFFCMGVVLFCAIMGGTKAEFIPAISITWNGYTIIGLSFYAVFLAVPTVMNIGEEILWHILRLKI